MKTVVLLVRYQAYLPVLQEKFGGLILSLVVF